MNVSVRRASEGAAERASVPGTSQQSVRPRPRLLVVDDEPAITSTLSPVLERAGFDVRIAGDGVEALAMVEDQAPDLVVSDVLMPRMDGREMVRRLRARGRWVPVILLTQVGETYERVAALDEGADDYLAKPFELAELEARLLALVRRARGGEHPRFACGALVYDPVGQQLLLRHQPLKLTPREHALLRALVQHSGEPLSKRDLMERVFADEADVQPEAVEVLVHRLRKRLEGSGVRISTLRGLGYVLEPDSAPDNA